MTWVRAKTKKSYTTLQRTHPILHQGFGDKSGKEASSPVVENNRYKREREIKYSKEVLVAAR